MRIGLADFLFGLVLRMDLFVGDRAMSVRIGSIGDGVVMMGVSLILQLMPLDTDDFVSCMIRVAASEFEWPWYIKKFALLNDDDNDVVLRLDNKPK